MLRALVGLGTGDGLKYHVRLFLNNEKMLILLVALVASTPLMALAIRSSRMAGWRIRPSHQACFGVQRAALSRRIYSALRSLSQLRFPE